MGFHVSSPERSSCVAVASVDEAPTTFLKLARTIREHRAATQLDGVACRRYHSRLRDVSSDGAVPLRLALAGNVTVQPLLPFLEVQAAAEGFYCASLVTPFAQHFQSLNSEALRSFDPTHLLLLLSPELWRPDAIGALATLSGDRRAALREDMLEEIERWVELALGRTRATLILGTFAPASRPALGLADLTSDYDEASLYHDLNRGLMALARREPRVQLLDVAGAQARVGIDQALDRRMFHIAKLGWSERMLAEVGAAFARSLVASSGSARKCVVVDLDNTLWGGVLGEDGPWGIQIGGGDPVGDAYAGFQRRLKELKSRGILLALCSKNNGFEVDALFAERTDMPLAAADFAARAVGWGAKHLGLQAIARTLNIGVDALVFLDDNPAEVAQVRSALPEVEAVLLPPDPADFCDALDGLICLEKGRLTAEDAGKAEQYAAAAARAEAHATTDDHAGYLADLQIEVEIRRACNRDLPRLHQLFTKTNQFNVTTRRYSMAELAELLSSRLHRVDVMTMRDRYGDFGLIAAAIVVDEVDHVRIDSLVMSCRAMGRGGETAMLNRIKREAGKTLRAEYRATPRNAPVRDLFTAQGFAVDHSEADGSAVYLITPPAAALPCEWLSVKEDRGG
jgi:FkbH-like protein